MSEQTLRAAVLVVQGSNPSPGRIGAQTTVTVAALLASAEDGGASKHVLLEG